jgi:hypothetical protein
MTTALQLSTNPLTELANREAGRALASTAAVFVARETARHAPQQVARLAAKGAVNPVLVVADMAELAVEKTTGSREAGCAVSFTVYVGTGAATGGPVGAAVGAGLWGVGQLVSYVMR